MVILKCKKCGKDFEVYPYRMKKKVIPRYCSFRCRNLDFTGEKAFRWKGGRRDHVAGYVLVYCPNHPHAHVTKTVMEHRLVMEKHLGRFLRPEERVHHINKIKTDNRIKNLKLFKSERDHQLYGKHR